MRKAMFALPLLLTLIVMAYAQSQTPQQIEVRTVTLNGVTQLSPAEQQHVIHELQKTYGIFSFARIHDSLREALQDLGFYKATVSQPKVTVISGSERDGTVDVDFDISEGQQYRLKAISFTHNQAFSPEELRSAIPMSDGEVFSTAKARRGFEGLRKFYVNHGYIDFVPLPELVVDEQAALITMNVDLVEGIPFRVGTLTFDGEPSTPESTAKLRQAWKEYQGRVYSDGLIPKFVHDNADALPPNKTDAQLFRLVVDQRAHIVDFRLELGQQSRAVSHEP